MSLRSVTPSGSGMNLPQNMRDVGCSVEFVRMASLPMNDAESRPATTSLRCATSALDLQGNTVPVRGDTFQIHFDIGSAGGFATDLAVTRKSFFWMAVRPPVSTQRKETRKQMDVKMRLRLLEAKGNWRLNTMVRFSKPRIRVRRRLLAGMGTEPRKRRESRE